MLSEVLSGQNSLQRKQRKNIVVHFIIFSPPSPIKLTLLFLHARSSRGKWEKVNIWRMVSKSDGGGIGVLCLPGKKIGKEDTVLKSNRMRDLLY